MEPIVHWAWWYTSTTMIGEKLKKVNLSYLDLPLAVMSDGTNLNKKFKVTTICWKWAQKSICKFGSVCDVTKTWTIKQKAERFTYKCTIWVHIFMFSSTCTQLKIQIIKFIFSQMQGCFLNAFYYFFLMRLHKHVCFFKLTIFSGNLKMVFGVDFK